MYCGRSAVARPIAGSEAPASTSETRQAVSRSGRWKALVCNAPRARRPSRHTASHGVSPPAPLLQPTLYLCGQAPVLVPLPSRDKRRRECGLPCPRAPSPLPCAPARPPLRRRRQGAAPPCCEGSSRSRRTLTLGRAPCLLLTGGRPPRHAVVCASFCAACLSKFTPSVRPGSPVSNNVCTTLRTRLRIREQWRGDWRRRTGPGFLAVIR